MSSARLWMESGFNVAYLVAVWWLVALMARRLGGVAPADRPVALRLAAAFALLALGDTGHVGLRVLAFALGDLGAPLAGGFTLVGLGALMTAVTLTGFYVVLADAWRVRFGRGWGVAGAVLLAAAAVRLLVMLHPANAWGEAVPPQPWSTYRNLPLMVQGLGLAWLILRDARSRGDRLFGRVGVLILVSYACYIPVVFWVQQAPAVGMLMIPKTLAYLAIALVGYRALFGRAGARLRPSRVAA